MDRERLSDEEMALLSKPMASSDGEVNHGLRDTVVEASEVRESTLDVRLRKIHERFVADLEHQLTEMARREVRCELREASRGTFGQFVFAQPTPTCCAIARSSLPLFDFFAAVQPTLMYPLIDRMMGSTPDEPVPQRPMTELEGALVTIALSQILEKYAACWHSERSPNFEVMQLEHNAQRLRNHAGSDGIYWASYDVRCSNDFGRLMLCLPWKACEQMFAAE